MTRRENGIFFVNGISYLDPYSHTGKEEISKFRSTLNLRFPNCILHIWFLANDLPAQVEVFRMDWEGRGNSIPGSFNVEAKQVAIVFLSLTLDLYICVCV